MDPHLYESIEILTHPDHTMRHGNFGKYTPLDQHYRFDPIKHSYYQERIDQFSNPHVDERGLHHQDPMTYTEIRNSSLADNRYPFDRNINGTAMGVTRTSHIPERDFYHGRGHSLNRSHHGSHLYNSGYIPAMGVMGAHHYGHHHSPRHHGSLSRHHHGYTSRDHHGYSPRHHYGYTSGVHEFSPRHHEQYQNSRPQLYNGYTYGTH